MSITLHQGSILDADVDFIVNPANSHLRHGGGLARVIADAARAFPPGMHAGDSAAQATAWNREQEQHPLVATGAVALTTAGALRYRGIIHAVGPVYGGGSFFESALLSSAHAEALALAVQAGGKSVAFPAISCGIFGYPVERAAHVAVRTCLASPLRVEFWLFEDSHMEAFTKALASTMRCAA